MQRHDPERYLVCGASGTGKSTYVKAHFISRPRVVVIDPKADYRHEPGFVKIDLGEPGWQKLFLGAIKAGWHTGYKIALIVGRGTEKRAAFNEVCDIALKVQHDYHMRKTDQWLTLIWEECSMLWPGGNMSSKEFCNAEELARLGRDYGIELVAVTQKPATVNSDIRANSSVKVLFRIGDQESYRAVSGMLSREASRAIEVLPNYHRLVVDPQGKWGIFDGDGALQNPAGT